MDNLGGVIEQAVQMINFVNDYFWTNDQVIIDGQLFYGEVDNSLLTDVYMFLIILSFRLTLLIK